MKGAGAAAVVAGAAVVGAAVVGAAVVGAAVVGAAVVAAVHVVDNEEQVHGPHLETESLGLITHHDR